jgi:hypothetical protein
VIRSLYSNHDLRRCCAADPSPRRPPSQLVLQPGRQDDGKPENLQGGEETDQVTDNFTANADSTKDLLRDRGGDDPLVGRTYASRNFNNS